MVRAALSSDSWASAVAAATRACCSPWEMTGGAGGAGGAGGGGGRSERGASNMAVWEKGDGRGAVAGAGPVGLAAVAVVAVGAA